MNEDPFAQLMESIAKGRWEDLIAILSSNLSLIRDIPEDNFSEVVRVVRFTKHEKAKEVFEALLKDPRTHNLPSPQFNSLQIISMIPHGFTATKEDVEERTQQFLTSRHIKVIPRKDPRLPPVGKKNSFCCFTLKKS
ncbi:MAG TPA: hypothetical protein VLE89_07100 [Chlamydiales bacterium]|nr:hypothetical protein [Chlamydiales bacterium]